MEACIWDWTIAFASHQQGKGFTTEDAEDTEQDLSADEPGFAGFTWLPRTGRFWAACWCRRCYRSCLRPERRTRCR